MLRAIVNVEARLWFEAATGDREEIALAHQTRSA